LLVFFVSACVGVVCVCTTKQTLPGKIQKRKKNDTTTTTPSKKKDPAVPLAWLSDLFDKYVPATAFEMRRAYAHVTPLNTMNWATSLVNILEVGVGGEG
jgi:hypothetical protein